MTRFYAGTSAGDSYQNRRDINQAQSRSDFASVLQGIGQLLGGLGQFGRSREAEAQAGLLGQSIADIQTGTSPEEVIKKATESLRPTRSFGQRLNQLNPFGSPTPGYAPNTLQAISQYAQAYKNAGLEAKKDQLDIYQKQQQMEAFPIELGLKERGVQAEETRLGYEGQRVANEQQRLDMARNAEYRDTQTSQQALLKSRIETDAALRAASLAPVEEARKQAEFEQKQRAAGVDYATSLLKMRGEVLSNQATAEKLSGGGRSVSFYNQINSARSPEDLDQILQTRVAQGGTEEQLKAVFETVQSAKEMFYKHQEGKAKSYDDTVKEIAGLQDKNRVIASKQWGTDNAINLATAQAILSMSDGADKEMLRGKMKGILEGGGSLDDFENVKKAAIASNDALIKERFGAAASDLMAAEAGPGIGHRPKWLDTVARIPTLTPTGDPQSDIYARNQRDALLQQNEENLTHGIFTSPLRQQWNQLGGLFNATFPSPTGRSISETLRDLGIVGLQ